MRRPLRRAVVGLATVFALFTSGANVAFAYDRPQPISNKEGPASSSSPELDPNIVSKQKDYADPTARNLVKKEMRLSDRQATNLLSGKIPLSLNLETSTQPLPDDLTSGISVQDTKSLNSLPNIDSKTGRASIPSPKNYEMFSIQVKDHAVDKVIDGVAHTQDNKRGYQTVAVSHITANHSGQIIGIIKDNDASFMDFNYTLPNRHKLEKRNDGGLNLVSEAGEVEGEIEAPWALDASGKQLPTRFELVDDHTLRQHVDTEGASFPIALDPSWTWWLVTAGKCAVSIAPLLATGGAAIAARAPKLISAINKLSKTPKIAAAVKKVGGAKNAAVAATKKAVITLRGRLPKGVASKLPSPKITSTEKKFIAVAWPFLGDIFWDAIGIGTCYSLARGK